MTRHVLAAGLVTLGLASLAGCAVDPSAADPTPDATPDPTPTGAYADGTFTVDAPYQSPAELERLTVTMTLADDAVAAVTVVGQAQHYESIEWERMFAEAISAEIVGKDLAELQVTRLVGASLTSEGFNDALDAIRAEASLSDGQDTT